MFSILHTSELHSEMHSRALDEKLNWEIKLREKNNDKKK